MKTSRQEDPQRQDSPSQDSPRRPGSLRLGLLFLLLLSAGTAVRAGEGPAEEPTADGAVPEASAGPQWARLLAGGNRDYADAVGVDDDGNVVVAGYFRRLIDVAPTSSGGALEGQGITDVFAVSFDSRGGLRWAARLGGPGADETKALAVGPDGEIYVVGFFSETADFDPGPGTVSLESAGSGDAFVARLSREGELEWARSFGGPFGDVALGVAASSAGVVVTGYFQGTADFDPGPGKLELTSAGRRDAFAVSLDPAGKLRWARRFGGEGDDEGRAVAVGAAAGAGGEGELTLITGRFSGAMALPESPPEPPSAAPSEDASRGTAPAGGGFTSAGLTDAFAVALDGRGKPAWSLRLGGAGKDVGEVAATLPDGDFLLSGTYSGTAVLEGSSLAGGPKSFDNAGGLDAFVLRLAPTGALAWRTTYATAGDDYVLGAAPGSPKEGSIYLGGFSLDVPDFEARKGPGPTRSFLRKLDGGSAVRWTRSYSATEGLQILALATGPQGAPRVAGSFTGEAELDLGPSTVKLKGLRKVDAFAVAVAP